MRTAAAALLLASGIFAGWPGVALAQSGGTGLLEGLGRDAPEQAGSVDAVAWIERAADGSALVIQLVPRGGARLVADPGIVASGVTSPGLAWAAEEVKLQESGVSYFATPPVVRLPFQGQVPSVTARVEYAYCIVDWQCLFGDAVVTAAVPSRGS
jgi:hypothetical protein